MPITSVNPTTGQVLKQFQEHTDHEVEQQLKKALSTLETWKTRPTKEKAVLLRKAGQILKDVCIYQKSPDAYAL